MAAPSGDGAHEDVAPTQGAGAEGHHPGRVWAIVGATGTGKTSLSLDLAEALAAHG